MPELFVRPWQPPTRKKYRMLCLRLRLQRMVFRAPHPSVEDGRAYARWLERLVQLKALGADIRRGA